MHDIETVERLARKNESTLVEFTPAGHRLEWRRAFHGVIFDLADIALTASIRVDDNGALLDENTRYDNPTVHHSNAICCIARPDKRILIARLDEGPQVYLQHFDHIHLTLRKAEEFDYAVAARSEKQTTKNWRESNDLSALANDKDGLSGLLTVIGFSEYSEGEPALRDHPRNVDWPRLM